MTLRSSLGNLLAAARRRRAAARRTDARLADPRLAKSPASQSGPLLPSRRSWLSPAVAGAASWALMSRPGHAAPPAIPTAGPVQDIGISVENFGARGDGKTDDAPAFQAAINSLGASGGRILLGARHYRLASAVTISHAYVMFQGQGYAEAPGPSGGTWLIIDSTGFTPFTVTNNTPGSETRGTTFRDLAVWQRQPPAKPGWAPANYPFVFDLDQMSGGVEFDNIYFCSITRGISSRLVGRLNIGYLKGQCYDTMLFLDEGYDTCRIDYIESWFFVSAEQDIADYMMEHYDVLRLGRVDGLYINNLFVFCARAGIHCIETKAGNAKLVIGIYGCDHARYGLWFDHVVYNPNGTAITIVNQIGTNHIRWAKGGGAKPFPDGAQIFLDNCTRVALQINLTSAGFVDGSPIQVSGPDNHLSIVSASLAQFNLGKHTPPAPGIYVADSGGNGPSTVVLGQPAKITQSSGGAVFATGGNGKLDDPRTRFEAFRAEAEAKPK